ncbi:MAG: LacI family DNA-binding transcriptional regulator [Propionibacteriaceae bacterium]|nr:LacI family DNA-binding transcriptional regulator [Micropruina sp.]HBX79677.1 LacI family transcriptional regulator [Propionibacteriaceae bacterium]HBY23701.1 LacI family transcriptional regulator [Propionibacteriaceae bacterium]
MAQPYASRRVTRTDVARHAGVSTAVVSYVVNNGPRTVAPETAARVREAMETLEYRPNLSARALVSGTSNTLGLIVTDSLNPHCAELAQAIGQAAAQHGHRVLVVDSGGVDETEQGLVEELLARQVDGLLFASAFLRSDPMAGIRSFGVPTVLIDCPGEVPGRTTVGPAAEQGMAALVEHLSGVHGCRRIALILGEGGFGDPDPRETGWRRTATSLGLDEGPLLVTQWGNAGGYQAGLELLAMDARPDAVIAGSDQIAIGLLRALHEASVRVPEDLPVVSFDGTHQSAYTWPALTVASQPVSPMAEAAVALLGDAPLAPGHHSFPMTLIVRRSCGCTA